MLDGSLIWLLGDLLDGLLACFLAGFLKRGDAGRADRLLDGFPKGLPGGWGRDFDSTLQGDSLAGELFLPDLDILRDPVLTADGSV